MPWTGARINSSAERRSPESDRRVFANIGLKQSLRLNDTWHFDASIDHGQSTGGTADSLATGTVDSDDFTAGSIGATLNGASIYFVARNNPEKVPPGMADKIGHFLNPEGPKGRFHMVMPLVHSIAGYSQNEELAAEFLRFLMGSKDYERYILVQKGYGLGATPEW